MKPRLLLCLSALLLAAGCASSRPDTVARLADDRQDELQKFQSNPPTALGGIVGVLGQGAANASRR